MTRSSDTSGIQPTQMPFWGNTRSRLGRLCFNPWSWVIVAGIVRVLVLGTLPVSHRTLAIGNYTGDDSHTTSLVAFLQNRVQAAPLTEDEHCYDEMARNLTAGRGFVLDSRWLITTPGQPAMYAGCFYPLFVAAVYFIFGVGNQLAVFLIQILLHAAVAWLIFRSAERVAAVRAGAIAAAFYAFHPTLIWSSVSMMSEAAVVPLVSAAAWLAVARPEDLGRRKASWTRPAALGVVLALLCLTRSVFAPLAGLTTVWLIYPSRKTNLRVRRLTPVVTFVVVYVLVCSPWTIRNYLNWQRVIPFSTKTGAALWMHNHPGLSVEFGPGAVFGPQPTDIYSPSIQALPDEPAREERLMSMFRDFVQDAPLKFAGLIWMRFWMALLPGTVTMESSLAVAASWYAKGGVLAALATAAWCVRKRLVWRILPWVVFVGYWQGLQSLAGSGMRYRLPADPVWACIVGILAAVVLARYTPAVAAPLERRWGKSPTVTSLLSGQTKVVIAQLRMRRGKLLMLWRQRPAPRLSGDAC